VPQGSFCKCSSKLDGIVRDTAVITMVPIHAAMRAPLIAKRVAGEPCMYANTLETPANHCSSEEHIQAADMMMMTFKLLSYGGVTSNHS
jgi:hypothetical protein